MKRILVITKNILKYWWWQDIEKPNIFLKFINLGMALFLSFCLLAWMCGEDWNIILRIIISIYGSACFMSFWPVSYMFNKKDKLKESLFFIFKKFFLFFSIVILISYASKEYKDKNM